jgi:hypothetical protein
MTSPKQSIMPGLPKHQFSEPRVGALWGEWLHALTCEPDAALAAADVYSRMTDVERDRWLNELERDVSCFSVPAVAVFAPLLAVEVNGPRRARMQEMMRLHTPFSVAREPLRALLGETSLCRCAVLVAPVYLDFFQVLACTFIPGERFLQVAHDPILRRAEAPVAGLCTHVELCKLAGVGGESLWLDETPVTSVVDELAVTIVAHERSGQVLPEALRSFSDWFSLRCD